MRKKSSADSTSNIWRYITGLGFRGAISASWVPGNRPKTALKARQSRAMVIHRGIVSFARLTFFSVRVPVIKIVGTQRG